MMKKIVLVTLFVLAVAPLSAAPANLAALEAYATKALTKCPDSKITLTPINQPGPSGFVAFALKETSSDTGCGRNTFLLYSPSSSQVIIGTVFALPIDNRSAEARISATASALLKTNFAVSIAAFPLPDGLHAVSMIKPTQWGPFSYHGYLDASQRFLIIGSRGNLYVDPGTTLVESIGIENAVRRGNPKSPVKIIELSDFECPTCGRAHKDIEPLIAKNLSKIDYYRLDFPLYETHEWAFPAALGGRAIEKVAAGKYWTYVNFLFENQEAIGKSGSFDKTLQNFCEDHDIDWKRVEKIYRSQAERAALLDQISRGYDLGVNSTPTYIVNGQMMGFGPKGTTTIAAIKKALGLPDSVAKSPR